MAEKSLNRCEFIGRLGKDAETKFTQGGTAVSNFSLACSESWKDKQSGELKEKTEWVNCVLWRAEKLATYLTKGSRIHVTGKFQTRKWEDKEGNARYSTEILVDDVILLGGGSNGNNGGGGSKPGPGGDASTLDDTDVPF